MEHKGEEISLSLGVIHWVNELLLTQKQGQWKL